MKKTYKREEIIDKFGQIPIDLTIWFLEEAPITMVEVDVVYLMRVLKRLVDLQRLAKTHLARADIPDTLNYILSIIPPKIIERAIKRKKEGLTL